MPRGAVRWLFGWCSRVLLSLGSSLAAVELVEGCYGWSVLGGAGWGVRVNLPLFHGALYVFWVCFMQLFHCRASLLFLAFFSCTLL